MLAVDDISGGRGRDQGFVTLYAFTSGASKMGLRPFKTRYFIYKIVFYSYERSVNAVYAQNLNFLPHKE
jgi:hypothetical protein